jgi:gluconolactonase
MIRSRERICAVLSILLAAGVAVAGDDVVPVGAPLASIDLKTAAGVGAVGGEWRYSDVAIVETAFRAAGADGQPTGAPNKTYDFTPHAGGADFDDSAWQVVAAESLEQRRGGGRLCFNWYRINVTVPRAVGDFDPAGSTLVFETSVDDYAEVWVDGELPRAAAQSGGSVIGGWNAANRLVIGRNVRPGQKIQLAVFGINGPISNPVTNYIWMRTARLDFYPGGPLPIAYTPREVNVEVLRLDPAVDELVPPNAKIYKLAEGFQFTEGPVWSRDGYLLFSDPNANRIYKYVPDGELSVFAENSGYSGADIAEFGQPGSNGLAFDAQGRLTIDQHGNHRVVRRGADGSTTVLADSYGGKRLNSPNDLVYKSDGALYFTDPPFGLPKFFDDPRKELPFSGVYRVADGKLQLLSRDLNGPNGLAFSPDEKFLYVDNWDPARKVVMRYPLRADGSLGAGEVFFDMKEAPEPEALDGLKVDTRGNLYVSGPGGVWILSPTGEHLGTIRAPQLPANFAWGDRDGRTLYMTARSGLYRMRLNVGGW